MTDYERQRPHLIAYYGEDMVRASEILGIPLPMLPPGTALIPIPEPPKPDPVRMQQPKRRKNPNGRNQRKKRRR